MTKRQWVDFQNQFDPSDLDQKLNFNDFLTMLLRESFFRDTLAESQIFRQSSRRLVFSDECKLISQQHLEILNEQKANLDVEKEV